MDPSLLYVVGAFVGAIALVGGIALIFMGGSPQAENRLTTFVSRGRLATKGAESPTILKEKAFEADKKALFSLIPKIPSVQRLVEQADVNVAPNSLLMISLLLALLGASLSWPLPILPLWMFPLTALGMFSLPWLWLLNKRSKRLKAFGAQLPDALELLGRALRAGHSLAAGMHVVAEEMPPPISTEFGRVYEEQNLGMPLEEALRSMCDRVPNMDLRFFVTSVVIQKQTGGDLAEIMDKIGYVIRERFKILGMVKALTAEGRLSGILLIAMLPLLFLVVMTINPGYLTPLWTESLGKKMLGGAIALQILGALVIKKIVTIKV